jgi:small subunit ribosomal protein S1
LTEDPWVAAARDLIPGSRGEGKVTKLTDFGVFVQLVPGVEGMIHVSELDAETVERPDQVVKEGDSVQFIVLSSDPVERRFSLSRKAHLKGLDGDSLKEYLTTVKEPQTAFADAFNLASKDTKPESVEADKA